MNSLDVDRRQEGQRHREEERVERALQRAVDEGRQAELRLEVVGAAGRLPDVLGRPGTPRTRPSRRASASVISGWGLSSLPAAGAAPRRPASGARRPSARRRRPGSDPRRACRAIRSVSPGRPVTTRAGRPVASAVTKPLSRRDAAKPTTGAVWGVNSVDARQAAPARILRTTCQLETSAGLIAVTRVRSPMRKPRTPMPSAVRRGVDRLGQHRVRRVAEVVPEELPARGGQEQVLAAAVQPSAVISPSTRRRQRLPGLFLAAGPDQGLLLDCTDWSTSSAGATWATDNGPPLVVATASRTDRPPAIRVDDGAVAERRLRRHGPAALRERPCRTRPRPAGRARPTCPRRSDPCRRWRRRSSARRPVRRSGPAGAGDRLSATGTCSHAIRGDAERHLAILVDSTESGPASAPRRGVLARGGCGDELRRRRPEEGPDLGQMTKRMARIDGDDDEPAHDDQPRSPAGRRRIRRSVRAGETTSGRAGVTGPPARRVRSDTAIYWILPSSSLAI